MAVKADQRKTQTLSVANKPLVPRLRFSIFIRGWSVKQLDNLCEIVGGGTPDTNNPLYWNGEINWFTPTEIKHKYLVASQRKISEDGLVNSSAKLLPAGTVLFSSRATIGDVAILKMPAATNQGFQSFVTNTGCSNEFLFYWITAHKKEFLRRASGSTFLEISKKTVGKIRGAFPEENEQKKIASFLSSIDAWIFNLRAQKEKLEAYKKGLMQKIFSQEIRFKDDNGKEFSDWEEKRLGDLFGFINSNSFSRNQLTYTEGRVKNLHYGDIHTQYKLSFDITREKVPFIKKEFEFKIADGLFCKDGDLIVADASEDYKDIGKTIELINLENESVVAGLHTFHLRKKQPSSFAVGFAGYLMRSEDVRRQIIRIATGISVLGVSKRNFVKISLKIPSVFEQRKAARFLNSIDRLIEFKDSQLGSVERWKKGLMQQLFV